MTLALESRLWLASVACLCACFILGYIASNAATLWRIDIEAAALRGTGVPLAALFTLSGRAFPLCCIALVGIGVTTLTRTGWKIAIAIAVTQLLSQGGAEFAKRLFARTRPDAWLVKREFGFSFPSGHATTAVVFYASWAVLVWVSQLRGDVKVALVALIAIWAAGIDWSRIALGAHYPTDVAGGTLFGSACAFAMWALLVRTAVVV